MPDCENFTPPVVGVATKVAVTELADVIVRTQGLVPLQSPDHPENDDPLAAVAVRVTLVPDTNDAEHVVPQLIPEGELVIVPVPPPAKVTVRV